MLASTPVPPNPTPRKIAVLRASGLGDLIFALPALTALRETFPSAEITLLAKEWHREFLLSRPGPVDRVVAIPPAPGVGIAPALDGDPPALQRFFAEMQAEQFHLAVQLHGGGRYSNPFVRNLGARVAIGLQDDDAIPLDRNIPYIYFQPEILRCLEVVALSGAATAKIAPHLTVTSSDVAASYEAVPDTAAPLVAIHPGATDPRRRWPPARFAAVAEHLAQEGCSVVLTGTAGEEALTRRIAGLAHAPVIDLCGRLSLFALTGLLARCSLVVSNDSGPLHLAFAVGTSTVGIYWCGNLINAEPITRATNRPVLSWRLNCPVCGFNAMDGRCLHDESFVADVTPAEVISQCLSVLSILTSRPASDLSAAAASM